MLHCQEPKPDWTSVRPQRTDYFAEANDRITDNTLLVAARRKLDFGQRFGSATGRAAGARRRQRVSLQAFHSEFICQLPHIVRVSWVSRFKDLPRKQCACSLLLPAFCHDDGHHYSWWTASTHPL